MHLTQLKLTAKIALGLSILLALLVGITVFNFRSILEAQNHLNRVVGEISARLAILEAQGNMIRDIQIRVRNIALLEDTRPMRDELNKLQAVRNVYDESEARLNRLFDGSEDHDLIAELVRLRTVGRPLTDEAIFLGLKNYNVEATKLLMDKVGPNTEQRLNVINRLIEQQQESARRTAIAASAAQDRAMALTAIIGVLAVVLCLGIGAVLLFFSFVVNIASSYGEQTISSGQG